MSDNKVEELYQHYLDSKALRIKTLENNEVIKCYNAKIAILRAAISRKETDLKKDQGALEMISRKEEQQDFQYEQDLNFYSALLNAKDIAQRSNANQVAVAEVSKQNFDAKLAEMLNINKMYENVLAQTNPLYGEIRSKELELEQVDKRVADLRQNIDEFKRINREMTKKDKAEFQQGIVEFAEYYLKHHWGEKLEQARIEKGAAKKKLKDALEMYRKRKMEQYIAYGHRALHRSQPKPVPKTIKEKINIIDNVQICPPIRIPTIFNQYQSVNLKRPMAPPPMDIKPPKKLSQSSIAKNVEVEVRVEAIPKVVEPPKDIKIQTPKMKTPIQPAKNVQMKMDFDAIAAATVKSSLKVDEVQPKFDLNPNPISSLGFMLRNQLDNQAQPLMTEPQPTSRFQFKSFGNFQTNQNDMFLSPLHVFGNQEPLFDNPAGDLNFLDANLLTTDFDNLEVNFDPNSLSFLDDDIFSSFAEGEPESKG